MRNDRDTVIEDGLGLTLANHAFTVTGLEIGRTYNFSIWTNVESGTKATVDSIDGSTESQHLEKVDPYSNSIAYSYVGVPTNEVVTIHLPALNYLTKYLFTAYQA